MPAKTKKPNLSKPYVENYPALKEWLDRHNAHCNWQKPLGDPDAPTSYVESWTAGGTNFILILHAYQFGWDVYTSSPSNSVAVSLADADARLAAFKSGDRP